MNNYALITGASSGIGYELAKIAASNKYNLILVARSEDKLKSIKTDFEEEFKINVEVMAFDLSNSSSPKQIWEEVNAKKLSVEILINNAGFGSNGRFDKLDWQNEKDQVQVNVLALMEMCHLFTPNLIKTGNGKIMNVGSIAGFIPGPFMATYYSTKAFVKSFSIALSEELSSEGIKVSALCPGATKTEFFERAKFATEPSKQNSRMLMTAQKVAEIGWHGLFKGKKVVITGLSNSIIIGLTKFVPISILSKASAAFSKMK